MTCCIERLANNISSNISREGQSLIAGFVGPIWGPSGAVNTHVGPMLVPWTLLSGNCLRYFLLLLRILKNKESKAGYFVLTGLLFLIVVEVKSMKYERGLKVLTYNLRITRVSVKQKLINGSLVTITLSISLSYIMQYIYVYLRTRHKPGRIPAAKPFPAYCRDVHYWTTVPHNKIQPNI